jgi:hypothetical protein
MLTMVLFTDEILITQKPADFRWNNAFLVYSFGACTTILNIRFKFLLFRLPAS